jgi:hypothetical protein
MAAPAKKPAFIPLPILASVTFIVLALGAQYGPGSVGVAGVTQMNMAELFDYLEEKLNGGWTPNEGDTFSAVDTITEMNYTWGLTRITFASFPNGPMYFSGNYTGSLSPGDHVRVTFTFTSGGMTTDIKRI